MNKFSYEALHVGESLRNYRELLGCDPPWVHGDRIFGTRENREAVGASGIRHGLIPLGRKNMKAMESIQEKT